MMPRKLFMTVILLGMSLVGVALSLALSSAGTVGAQGGVIPDFVGSDTCGDCHVDIARQHQRHGHSYILNKVDGQQPTYPYSELPSPPEGYTWEDVGLVVGGFYWRARFLDRDGYVITGRDENAATQYNFPIADSRTGEVIVAANWEPYRPGEPQRPYTCASCHTTGYNYNPTTHMYDLPGLNGMWEEEGVQCEECHGPGSLHVQDPIRARLLIDRSKEACAACHGRGEAGAVQTSDGFILHHEQYDEIMTATHAALDCVDCHDPHRSAVYADEEVNPRRGLRAQCTDCHFGNTMAPGHAENGVTCVDCHMPPMAVSGSRNPELLWADLSAHLYQINTDPAAEQFSEDGGTLRPYTTVRYACTRCHADWTVEQMAEAAQGYHDRE